MGIKQGQELVEESGDSLHGLGYSSGSCCVGSRRSKWSVGEKCSIVSYSTRNNSTRTSVKASVAALSYVLAYVEPSWDVSYESV